MFHNVSSSTLYGVTNPVTEVINLVTHEESLTTERVARGEAGLRGEENDFEFELRNALRLSSLGQP